MNIPQEHHEQIASVCETLRKALAATAPTETRRLAADALHQAESLALDMTDTASKIGRMGGKQTAKRGSDYFRKIAGKRKTYRGGRPRKQAE
jgi:hypothetical protein